MQKAHSDFAHDMNVLLAPTINWPIDEAFALVKSEIINLIAGESWLGT